MSDNEFQHDDEEVRRAHAERLLIAQNVANNGRWFCALLVLVNALNGQPVVAICAAVPIGMSMLVDLMKPDRWRNLASALVWALASFLTVLSIQIHW